VGIVLDVVTIGLQTGAIYALIALGLALVFKATRVLNFAHGEIGTSSAFVAYLIMTALDGCGPFAGGSTEPCSLTGGQLLVATVPALIAGAVLGVVTKLVIDRLKDASAVTTLVATIGVAVFMTAVQLKVAGAEGFRFPRFIEGNAFRVPGGNIPISWHTLVILVVLGIAAGMLAVYFKTPPGIALLATSQDPFAAQLQGVNVKAMTTSAWGVAGALAAAAGLLGAGVFNQLTPGLVFLTFLIPAFTGALLGGITSMVGAVVGGLLLGLIVTTANQINTSFDLGVPGPPQIAVLAALLLVLLLRPRGLLGSEA
jgi:branched-chain amino acid transport system permease protein